MHTDTYTRSEVPRGRLLNGTATLKRCLSHLRWGCFCRDMRPAAWLWKRPKKGVCGITVREPATPSSTATLCLSDTCGVGPPSPG